MLTATNSQRWVKAHVKSDVELTREYALLGRSRGSLHRGGDHPRKAASAILDVGASISPSQRFTSDYLGGFGPAQVRLSRVRESVSPFPHDIVRGNLWLWH